MKLNKNEIKYRKNISGNVLIITRQAKFTKKPIKIQTIIDGDPRELIMAIKMLMRHVLPYVYTS